MRKFFMLLAAASIAGLSSTTVYASDESEALIQACEQQNPNASDRYTTVMHCLDEKLQYDTSDSGE
jgi:hypothetical protein